MPVLVPKKLHGKFLLFLLKKIGIKMPVSPKKILSSIKQSKNRDRRASLTAEAAMTLPLFLYSLYTIWQCFLLLLLQLSMCAEVAEITLSSASLGYLEQQSTEETKGMTWLYEPLLWNALLGKERAESVRVSLKEKENGKIEGSVTYAFALRVPFFSEVVFPITQSFCFLPYVGEQAKDAFAKEEAGEANVVYVTENGTVYHERKTCSYLSVAVFAVLSNDIPGKRNNYGKKYDACRICGGESTELVYVSASGTKYHTSMECASIKRLVEEKNREEVSLPACSRCGEQ